MSEYLYASSGRGFVAGDRSFGDHPNFRNPRAEDVAIYGRAADFLWTAVRGLDLAGRAHDLEWRRSEEGRAWRRSTETAAVRIARDDALRLAGYLLSVRGLPLAELYRRIDENERERRDDRWREFMRDWRPGGWRHLAGPAGLADRFEGAWELAAGWLLDAALDDETPRLGAGWGAHTDPEAIEALGVEPA